MAPLRSQLAVRADVMLRFTGEEGLRVRSCWPHLVHDDEIAAQAPPLRHQLAKAERQGQGHAPPLAAGQLPHAPLSCRGNLQQARTSLTCLVLAGCLA